MTDEKKKGLKAQVAAAMTAIAGRGEHPSTPRIRAELKLRTGRPGNQNEVDECRREIIAEQRAATEEMAAPDPIEPLPETVTSELNAFADTLARVLTDAKAGYRQSADTQVMAIKADADRRVEEAELDARDYARDVERCENEIETLQAAAESQLAELATVKEALALEQGRNGQLQADCDAAKVEATEERKKAGDALDEAAAAKTEAARLKAERDAATRDAERLNREHAHTEELLEKATAKNGELAAELQSVRLEKAELDGQNKQLLAERDRYRDELKVERARGDNALEEARGAKAEAAKLAEALKAVNGKKGGSR